MGAVNPADPLSDAPTGADPAASAAGPSARDEGRTDRAGRAEEVSGEASPQALGLREQKKRRTRIDMHRAALELVAEHGFTQVTVEMIARRAGVSTRTFFNHWATKDSAVLGIITGEALEIADQLRAALATLSPREALRSVLRDALTAVPSDPALRELKKQVMVQEPRLHSLSSGKLLEVQTELVDVLADALDGDRARTRAAITVQIGFSLSRSAFAMSMAHGMELTEAFDEVVDLYDSGRIAA